MAQTDGTDGQVGTTARETGLFCAECGYTEGPSRDAAANGSWAIDAEVRERAGTMCPECPHGTLEASRDP